MADIEVHSSPSVSLVMDSRHFPVIIGTWLGTPDKDAAQVAASWVTRMFDRAVQEGTPFVLISDSSQQTRPTTEVRAIFAQALDDMNTRESGRLLGILAVVHSKLVRASMAMILWMLRSRFPLMTVGTTAIAIERAKALLDNAGASPPAELDPPEYRRPLLPGEELDEVGDRASR